MDYIAHYHSPLGGITMASDGKALVGLWFEGQRHFAQTLSAQHIERSNLPVFELTRHWLNLYFSGIEPSFTPSIVLRTSHFHRCVSAIVQNIPFGHTSTYGDIARAIARQHGAVAVSARAVGSAIGHNSIMLIVPCHRVLGANGKLTGYAGGIKLKAQLLQLEQWRGGITL